MIPMTNFSQKERLTLFKRPHPPCPAFRAMSTARIGNAKCNTSGFRKVMPRLLTQRIYLEVVKARRGARIAQSAAKAKIVIKRTIRIVISLGIFTMAVKQQVYGNLSP